MSRKKVIIIILAIILVIFFFPKPCGDHYYIPGGGPRYTTECNCIGIPFNVKMNPMTSINFCAGWCSYNSCKESIYNP